MTQQPAAKPTRLFRHWQDHLFLVSSLAISASIVYALMADYPAGLRNQSGIAGRAGIFPALGSCAGFVLLTAMAALFLGLKRPSLSKLVAYLLMWILPFFAAGITKSVFQRHATYEAGFSKWIENHVDSRSIQAWLATQPTPPDSTVVVPPQNWPPIIQTLRPERVDLWKDQGVVLTWGVVGHDGDRRQIFIPRHPDFPPPTEVLWIDSDWQDAWRPIEDGWPSTWQKSNLGIYWWFITQA